MNPFQMFDIGFLIGLVLGLVIMGFVIMGLCCLMAIVRTEYNNMKTLLKGGPLDGQVIQTDRNQFGYGIVTTISTKGGPEVETENHSYWNTYKSEPHPAMNRGNIRVFAYGPDPRKS